MYFIGIVQTKAGLAAEFGPYLPDFSGNMSASYTYTKLADVEELRAMLDSAVIANGPMENTVMVLEAQNFLLRAQTGLEAGIVQLSDFAAPYPPKDKSELFQLMSEPKFFKAYASSLSGSAISSVAAFHKAARTFLFPHLSENDWDNIVIDAEETNLAASHKKRVTIPLQRKPLPPSLENDRLLESHGIETTPLNPRSYMNDDVLATHIAVLKREAHLRAARIIFKNDLPSPLFHANDSFVAAMEKHLTAAGAGYEALDPNGQATDHQMRQAVVEARSRGKAAHDEINARYWNGK